MLSSQNGKNLNKLQLRFETDRKSQPYEQLKKRKSSVEKPKNENSFFDLEAEVDQAGFIDPNTVSRGRSNSLRAKMVKQSKSLFYITFFSQGKSPKRCKS